MAKVITISYGDREGYDRTPQSIRSAAHVHDKELLGAGATIRNR